MTNAPSQDSATDQSAALYTAVGFIAVQFAQIEQSLDMMVAAMYQSKVPGERPKKIPKMLTVKLDYISQCALNDDDLSRKTIELLTFVDDVKRISELRHNVIHGAIARLQPIDGAFIFAKLDIEGGQQYLREVSLDIGAFPAIADDFIGICSRANDLTSFVLEAK